MLIQQRRGATHAHGRERQTHRCARRAVFTDHRMLDLLQPLARAILFAVDELADGIERRRGKMARLRLVGEFVGAELTDESGKRPGDFIGVFVAIARIFPFGSGEGLIGHPVLRELLPHVRHIRGEVNIAAVLAAIDVRSRAAVGFCRPDGARADSRGCSARWSCCW